MLGMTIAAALAVAVAAFLLAAALAHWGVAGTTIAVFVAAVLEISAILWAAWLAYRGVARQMEDRRNLEKQTNSIQVMLTLCSDKDLYDASRIVSEIEDNPDDSSDKYAHPLPEKLTHPDSALEKEEWLKKRSALRALVNFFETVSVGVRQNIYDESIIRGCARALFVKNYERTEPFILKMRKESNIHSYGENFQRVAKKFADTNSSSPQ